MGIETIALVGAGISAATTVGSTVAGMASASVEGAAQSNAARYRAGVAANEAALARANAKAAARDAERAYRDASRVGEAGQRQVQRQDQRARMEIGELMAAQGASGLRGASQGAARSTLRALAAQDRFNLRESVDGETSRARSEGIAFEQEAINQENAAKGLDSQRDVALAEGRWARDTARMRVFATGIEGAAGLTSTLVTAGSNPLVSNWFAKRAMRSDSAMRPAYSMLGLGSRR